MKKNQAVIMLSILVFAHILFIFFIFYSHSAYLFPFFLFSALISSFVAILILSHSCFLHSDEVSLQLVDDKLQLRYSTIYYELVPFNDYSSITLPKIDTNGNKVFFITRNRLIDYCKNKYDKISIPPKYDLVSPHDALNEFSDLKICSDDMKEQFIKHRMGIPASIVFLFLLLIILLMEREQIIYAIQNHLFFNRVLLLFGGLILYLIYYTIHWRTRLHQLEEMRIYSCDVTVYDRKAYTKGEDSSYYIRVWDNKRKILDQWFPVSKLEYEKIKVGTLYVMENGDCIFIQKSNKKSL